MGALTRALRNVSRRKMRAFLVVIALSFSMAIMISVPAGIVANQASTQSLAERYNGYITTTQEEINKTASLIECRTSSGGGFSGGYFRGPPGGSEQEVFLNETIVDEIHTIEGVKDVVPFLETSSTETISETITGREGISIPISRPVYTITGVCLNSSLIGNYSILPTGIEAGGRNLCEGDSGVLVMNSNLTDYFGVGAGGKVSINGESFTVVGIYNQTGQAQGQGRFQTPGTVYMNIFDAQTTTGHAGNITRLDVYAKDTSYVDGIKEAIIASYSEIQVTTYKDRLSTLQIQQESNNETLATAESTLSQMQTIATTEIIVAIVATSLIVLFVMLYTVRERTKEIGTLKAIGFSSWNVMSQFMLEGMLLSLVAGVVGIAIGSIGAPVLSKYLLPPLNLSGSSGSSRGSFGFNFSPANLGMPTVEAATAVPNPQLMLLALGAAVLLGVLGSLYPAWRASRTRPAEAMRYE